MVNTLNLQEEIFPKRIGTVKEMDVLHLASDGKPQLTMDDQGQVGTESVTLSTCKESPKKMCNIESPRESTTKMEPTMVSVSPQGKGVGVFGLESSPGSSGQKSDELLKDPKVNLQWGWQLQIYMYMLAASSHYSSSFSSFYASAIPTSLNILVHV